MLSPLRQEPKALELIELLRRLPLFDASKKARELQGETPEVEAAERQFHSWNAAHQSRVEGELIRSPVLLALFELPEWKNFQRLLAHSKAGRERRKNSNKRYRDKQTPEQVYWACRDKRRARLSEWLKEHGPRLIGLLRISHPVGGNTRFDPEVLNELEVRFVDEARAESEYWRLLWPVVLEQHRAYLTPETRQRVEKVAQQVFGHYAEQEAARELDAYEVAQ